MLPVLMYHNVGERERHLNVSPQALYRQCRLLQIMGFRAVTLSELQEHLRTGGLPRRTVVFTFDDALLGVYHYALPILQRFGWRATVFAVSQKLGGVTDWAPRHRHRVMNREQIAELHRQGWEIGAHTLTHPYLTRLPPEDAWREIAQCKDDLQELTGAEILAFCYPYGDLNNQIVQTVRACGYESACTTRKGLVRIGDDPLLLPRVPVAYSDGALGLLYRLWRAWRYTRLG
ncbi:MAG: polysaccharide deacetylase family protein [Chthonomonadetes bacterium]|nr:polysaccharide deacetylase family protein [Chthonomonadetes bacterium]